MQFLRSRRSFIGGMLAVGGAGLFNTAPITASAEPPPETTKIRLPRWIGSSYCWAGAYIAGELLRAEGFKVFYFQGDPNLNQSEWIAKGETDFNIDYAPMHIQSIEAGVPIKVLTGLHSGCLELVANDNVRSVADLKGKRVGVWLGGPEQLHVSLMVAYVGLDPNKDIKWVHREGKAEELLLQGKIDAFLAGPPVVQKARAQKIGHVILDTTTDAPWSQQFCCMISAREEYIAKYPIATKRVLRAILKSADLCASNPSVVAQKLVDDDFVPSHDYALQALSDIRYDNWREYDPEASLLFFGLRMQEIGMIKTNPQKIIEQGSDWRFLNELKRELRS